MNQVLHVNALKWFNGGDNFAAQLVGGEGRDQTVACDEFRQVIE